MKKSATLIALLSAAILAADDTASQLLNASTPQLVWEDVPPTSTVSQIVQQFAPRTSLSSATNYTDSATNGLVKLLTDPDDFLLVARADRSTFAVSAEFATAAHRADSSDGLIAIDDDEYRSTDQIFSQIDARTTTNDVLDIVTNVDIETQWVFTIIAGGEYTNPSDYHIVELDDGFGVLFGTEFITSIPGTAEFPFRFNDGLNMATVEVDRKNITRNALGLARLADIAPSVSNTVTKAYVEALGFESGGGITTNDVCNIVTNEVYSWEFVTDGPFDTSNWRVEIEGSAEDYPNAQLQVYENETSVIAGSIVDVRNLQRVDFGVDWAYGPQYTLSIVKSAPRNALGLARRSDITNTVTKAYVEGLGIEAGISAETATNIAESVVNATVTGVVRAVSFKVKDYIFDPVTEICWRRQMVDGYLDYIAVTNIDVTLPENYEALEALERRDNQ